MRTADPRHLPLWEGSENGHPECASDIKLRTAIDCQHAKLANMSSKTYPIREHHSEKTSSLADGGGIEAWHL